jgi:hypothetical protein
MRNRLMIVEEDGVAYLIFIYSFIVTAKYDQLTHKTVNTFRTCQMDVIPLISHIGKKINIDKLIYYSNEYLIIIFNNHQFIITVFQT